MKTFIIENNPSRAQFYIDCGIDRIFIDLEKIGKEERQAGLNTVKSFDHCISDISKVKNAVKSSGEVLVRVNPIHENSKSEINQVIQSGADVIMLPFFTTSDELDFFLDCVQNRCKTILLFETPQALVRAPYFLTYPVDEVYLGLNDLHLGLKLKFMFELLAFGFVDHFAQLCIQNNKKFGFGGLASLDSGLIPGSLILSEHARLRSSMVILSRTFKNAVSDQSISGVMQEIKKQYNYYVEQPEELLNNNKHKVLEIVKKIITNE